MRIRKASRRGVALVAAIGLTFLVLALGAALLTMSTSELVSSKSQADTIVARNVAEAGAEIALNQWNNGVKPAALSGNVQATVDGKKVTVGSYSLTAVEDTTNHVLTITTNGMEANAPAGSNGQTVRVRASGQAGDTSAFPFAMAAFAKNSIRLEGSGSTDSYDSAKGSYSSQTPGKKGGLGTNSSSNTAITASGNPIIKGKVMGGPGANATIMQNNWGTPWSMPKDGFGVNPEPVDVPDVELPENTTPFASVKVVKDSQKKTTAANGTNSLTKARSFDKYNNNYTWDIPSGVYNLDKIDLGSDQNVVNINGDVTLVCNSTGTAVLTGGNTKFNINGSLKIIANGEVKIGNSFSNANLQNPHQPAKVQILGTPNCKKVVWSGYNDYVGVLYAPQADVELTASSNMYGAVVANNILMNGAGIIHYDEQLANLSVGGGQGEVSNWRFITWEQL